MDENCIQRHIREVLIGDARANALELVAFWEANEMQFVRGSGYWEDKYYWMITYKNKYVCFVLIGDSEGTGFPWTIWSDDSGSHWFEEYPLNEQMIEIAWENVDICGKCGSCSGGIDKTIFGKTFQSICRTTFRFDNPDAQTLECIKQLSKTRENDILQEN